MSIPQDSPIILIVGTRPEGIKMAPVYRALKRAGIPTLLCSTMQHNQLLQDVLDLFDITPDIELNIMRPGQDLFYVTQAVLQKTKEFFLNVNPALVLVQGDTSSTMAAALSAFYLGIPVGHIEAGLRSNDIKSPFPEEINRRLTSVIARYHFAPTPGAVGNLLAQNIPQEQVFYTGNTVVDALYIIKEKIVNGTLDIRTDIRSHVALCKQNDQQIAIFTMHRRESLKYDILRVLATIKDFAYEHEEIFWFYPYHPNPQVIEAIHKIGLADLPNMYLCEPLEYKEMVYLLNSAHFVITDSGGIQEEAVSLGKPILVLREKTERMEGVLAGYAKIVGCDREKIIEGINWFLQEGLSQLHYNQQIYGDGHAAEKIAAFVQSCYEELQPVSFQSVTEESVIVERQEKDNIMEKVCILGLGYIGLPTGILIAESGYEVIGIDIDVQRVHEINNGNPVIHEPEIYEKLQYVLGSDQFRASTRIEEADYFIIAVPTPITKEKKADLSYVFAAADSIASVLKKNNVVIIESTVPVGSTKQITEFLEQKSGLQVGVDFFVAYCPERVLPGSIFHELVSNDRIIGGINQQSLTYVKQLYKSFVDGYLYLTDAQTAEMVKLVENSSRDTELAFAHQVASMAYSIGLNPYEVIKLANKHPRVNILQPTCGVGGHCLAVDPWFLVESFPQHTQLIKAARETNDSKPIEVINCIVHTVNEWQKQNTDACTVLLLGATYKPDIDDLRESPALKIIQNLINDHSDIHVLVTEPHVSRDILNQYCANRIVSTVDGIAQANIVVFLVGHKRFKVLDRKLFKGKQILDFCGILYESKKDTRQSESMFWPARSMMDFFIVNQPNNEQIKGDT